MYTNSTISTVRVVKIGNRAEKSLGQFVSKLGLKRNPQKSSLLVKHI